MNIPSKPQVELHGNFIDGHEIEAGRGELLDVLNPATGDVIASVADGQGRLAR